MTIASRQQLAAAPLERFALRSLGGLVAVLVIGAAFGIMAALVRVRWQPMRRLDTVIADGLNAIVSSDALLREVLIGITDLGGTAVLVWMLVLTGVWLLVRRQRRLAVFIVVASIGAMVLNAVVKQLVGRLRPVLEDPFYTVAGDSFPSGHAMSSLATYGAIVLVFAPALGRVARWVLLGSVSAILIAIGFTRLALGAHFLSDVLAGWLLGAVWLVLVTVAFHRWRQEEHIPETGPLPGDERDEDLRPVPLPHPHTLAHPWQGLGILVIGWVVLAGALSWLGFLIMQAAPPADLAVARWFEAHRAAPATAVLDLVALLGSTPAVIAIAFAVWSLTVAATRTWQPLLFLAVTLVGQISLFLTVSSIVDRQRPPVDRLNPNLIPTASFPSGHVAATLALYTATALLVWAQTRQWWRWVFVGLAVATPLAVGVQRLYGGVHHPTDLIGSVLLALPWTILAWRIVCVRRAAAPPVPARRLVGAGRDPS